MAAERHARNTRFVVDQVMQTLEGQRSSHRVLHDLLAGIPDPDLLHAHLQAVLLTGEPERLRAFCRTLQKRLESVR